MEERKKTDLIICHSMHQKEETRETRKYHTSPVVKFKHTHTQMKEYITHSFHDLLIIYVQII
jgi:hypothetical protein